MVLNFFSQVVEHYAASSTRAFFLIRVIQLTSIHFLLGSLIQQLPVVCKTDVGWRDAGQRHPVLGMMLLV